MDWITHYGKPIFDSIVYSILGTAILLGSFWAIEKILPFSMKKEITEDHNTALGVILGAFIIAIAIIVSTAIK
jgi:uncharacterized membrane protein YjfL (UPF0719 family)